MNFSYTYSHSLGFANEASDSAPRVNNPNYWYKNYGDTALDIRHNFTASFAMELPFGKGKRWVTSGVPAHILGGWQINSLAALRTGPPVTPTAPATVLNAPGSGNFADCNGPVAVIGDRTQWWDRRNLSDPNATDPNNARFGTCGSNVLRGPGLVNVDAAVFRRFSITERIDLQFRAEAFNVSNTPHFANPNSDIAASGFGISNGTQNTGREGIDHRFFRFGLRLGF
jgi:hypothetical protein